MEMKHTSKPWKADDNHITANFLTADEKFGDIIGKMNSCEDAELVVRSVNSHSELLALAEETLEAIYRGGSLQLGEKGRNAGMEDRLKLAIAKAKKVQP